MAETFDADLQRELERHDNQICTTCGYVGEVFEFEDGVCPVCKSSVNEEREEEY